MLDVLVTCLPHGPALAAYPQVRGHYLAKHLAHSGLRAEFRELPLPSARCRVVICSEYQSPTEYFRRELEPLLTEIKAERMYCMAARTLLGLRDQFSREYREWFAATGGGVLCHLPTDKLEPYDSWIGVGVDPEVIPAPVGPSNRVLFDFPCSSNENAASTFDVSVLDEVRAQLSECTIAGSGPAEAPVRDAFDEWIAYGQDHATYVRAAYRNLFAFVPGWQESMGMPFAEAQMAGACIVFSERQAPEAMLCPDAAISYQAGDPRSLARALADARTRDRGRIRQQAAERFDFTEVVKRTRAAIGLTQSGLVAKLAGVARRTNG